MFRIRAKIAPGSLQGVLRTLAAIDKKAARKALRRAVTLAARLVREDAKARLSAQGAVRTGLLRKSLGVKLKSNFPKGYVYGVVGPRRGFKREIGQMIEANAIRSLERRGARIDRKPVYADPVRYAHLVEYGTKHSQAKPFMRPALDENKTRVIDLMTSVIREAIAKAKG